QPGVTNLIFYARDTPPPGIFDAFLAIPSFTEDISTRSFISLVQTSPANLTTGLRGAFHTVTLLKYLSTMTDAILNETEFWGAHLALDSAVFISYDIEPFLPTTCMHITSPSAFPPSRGHGYLPLNLYFDPLSDGSFYAAMRQSARHLTNVANAEGQDIAQAPLYLNYALYDTPLDRMYGDNLGRLQSIKVTEDQDNVAGRSG
ncbi:hypothetical protein K438DRAFT_1462020, partial [Mycena galopus ATCC 62051]